jgi:hypothetical protein
MAFQITQEQAQDVKAMLKEFFFWMRENSVEKVTLERSDKELKIEFDNPVAFIEWLGGTCPVSEDTMVECKLRDGRVFANLASDVSWEHREQESSVDIVGYRAC